MTRYQTFRRAALIRPSATFSQREKDDQTPLPLGEADAAAAGEGRAAQRLMTRTFFTLRSAISEPGA